MRLAPSLAALVLPLALTGCGEDEKAADPKAPVDVEVGKTFSWNDFTVPDGWEYDTVTEEVSMTQQTHPLVRARVVNDGSEKRSALFEFVFALDGERVATIRCNSTTELAPGDEGDLLCPGLGQPVPEDYDQIVVQEITR